MAAQLGVERQYISKRVMIGPKTRGTYGKGVPPVPTPVDFTHPIDDRLDLFSYVEQVLSTGGKLTLPVYASNAAALTGGLVAGQLYKTAATGTAAINVVNAT